jgi:hypothetical protein
MLKKRREGEGGGGGVYGVFHGSYGQNKTKTMNPSINDKPRDFARVSKSVMRRHRERLEVNNQGTQSILTPFGRGSSRSYASDSPNRLPKRTWHGME